MAGKIIPFDKLNAVDRHLIHKIILRLVHEFGDLAQRIDIPTLEIDIIACHLVDTRLDLGRWLKADAYEFTHDITGIYENINRETLTLKHGFSPRFAK